MVWFISLYVNKIRFRLFNYKLIFTFLRKYFRNSRANKRNYWCQTINFERLQQKNGLLLSMSSIKILLIVFSLLLGVATSSYAQINPPEPRMDSANGEGPPCKPRNDVDPGDTVDGGGIPPPVGLCLPIDDYVYVLLGIGVLFGCHRISKIELL